MRKKKSHSLFKLLFLEFKILKMNIGLGTFTCTLAVTELHKKQGLLKKTTLDSEFKMKAS